jgi:hypothetical protein
MNSSRLIGSSGLPARTPSSRWLHDQWISKKISDEPNSLRVWNACVRAEDVVVGELGEYSLFSKLLTRRTTLPSEALH